MDPGEELLLQILTVNDLIIPIHTSLAADKDGSIGFKSRACDLRHDQDLKQ